MSVIKRDGRVEEFNVEKIVTAAKKAYQACNSELSKEVENAPQETFLIIDATTGQNGVIQAKAFAEVTSLTGVVITKMDGTSKGGIILAIRDELGVPVRFIGLGEKMDDLEEFDLDKYLYGLCVENE